MAFIDPVEVELKPDEIVLWQGRPNKQAIPVTIRVFGWIMIAILAGGMEFGARIDPSHRVMFEVTFFLFAPMFWWATYNSPIAEERYAVTDKRLFSTRPDDVKGFHVDSIGLSRLQSLTIKQKAGGVGILVCISSRQEVVTFHYIEQVLEISQIIRGAQERQTDRLQ